jgi:hypothetical protein
MGGEMRHIDDIKFEAMACLQRAREINDGALVNGLEFILQTLREYQQALRVQDELEGYDKVGGTE